METTKIDLGGVRVEVDTDCGVLHVHDKGNGHTLLRMCGLNHAPVCDHDNIDNAEVTRMETGKLVICGTVTEVSYPLPEGHISPVYSSRTLYAAGWEDSDGNMGMFAGPVADINDLLTLDAPASKPVGGVAKIVRLVLSTEGETVPMYQWSSESHSWEKITQG